MSIRRRCVPLFLAVAVCAAASGAQAAQTVQHPFLGITHITRTETAPRNLRMHIVLVDLTVPRIRFELTGPGGSFFNSLNNVTLNDIPDVTMKAAWDPRIGANKLHIEGWALYRDFFDRFNFENHHVADVSFGGHIALEVVPKTLDLSFSAAHGTLGRFSAAPFPDATLAQDGTILPLTITSAAVGLIWHTLPTLDIYTYAGLEKTKAAFADVGTVPFGLIFR